jgi:hypothetical protein
VKLPETPVSTPRLNYENANHIQLMIEQASRLAQHARASQWSAFQAQQDAWLMRAEMSSQLEEFGKEEAFRRRYVATMLPLILEGAMDYTRADKGNIQLCSIGGPLQMCAQRGFDQAFLEFFGGIRVGQTACSLAQRNAELVVVRDVTESAVFDCTAVVETLLDAGVRSVQSMPLLSESGRVIGVLSTHSSRVKKPSAGELKRMGNFARWAAALLEWRERPAASPVV